MNSHPHRVIFLLFLYATCSLESRADLMILQLENPIEYESKLNRLLEFCGDDYMYRKLTVIAESGSRDWLSSKVFRKVNEAYQTPVELFDDIKALKSVGWQACVVLCISAETVVAFSSSPEERLWIPGNMYVIYVPKGLGEVSPEEFGSLGSLLWRRNYVHKVVLSTEGRNLYFDPFEPRELGGFGALRNLEDSVEPLKKRQTFAGYEVNISMFPYLTLQWKDGRYVGLEANSMLEICARMNVTPQLYEPPEKFGWFWNGTFTGTLGRLTYHQSDLAFNEFFVKNYGTENLEYTTYLSLDQICVIVPRRARVPEYLMMVRIFSPLTWALISFGNAVLALVYVIVTHLSVGRTRDQTSAKSCPAIRIQDFVAACVFYSFYPMNSNTKWISERIHIASGLVLGVVVSGYFTSQLASSFSKPAFLKNIDTLEELDHSGLKILTNYPNLLSDVFADDEPSTLRNLQAKLTLNNGSEIEWHVFHARDAGFLEREQSALLEGSTVIGLHVVPDCPRKYHLAYPIAKGSPFQPRLNTLIGRLHNAGFYRKWFEDLKRRPEPIYNSRPVVIRLHHLYVPFFLLIGGLGVSVVVFCSEIKGSFVRTEKSGKKKA
ncbi:uncharacterized protein LOC124183073 isoform X1 [Neodiprion fabricii]|uniref:uncharacterized protein LOC124183073 isoform X1 n=1 Tax=Neodiprion fabricii TaxID=2872261 RepID=UPI001ED95BCA|nr:uncharacterized protein LOC124183073 isoform X1 [Neodiprion fabricii]